MFFILFITFIIEKYRIPDMSILLTMNILGIRIITQVLDSFFSGSFRVYIDSTKAM